MRITEPTEPVSGCRGNEGKNAEIGQEYFRLFFSMLLIEPPNTIRLAMAQAT